MAEETAASLRPTKDHPFVCALDPGVNQMGITFVDFFTLRAPFLDVIDIYITDDHRCDFTQLHFRELALKWVRYYAPYFERARTFAYERLHAQFGKDNKGRTRYANPNVALFLVRFEEAVRTCYPHINIVVVEPKLTDSFWDIKVDSHTDAGVKRTEQQMYDARKKASVAAPLMTEADRKRVKAAHKSEKGSFMYDGWEAGMIGVHVCVHHDAFMEAQILNTLRLSERVAREPTTRAAIQRVQIVQLYAPGDTSKGAPKVPKRRASAPPPPPVSAEEVLRQQRERRRQQEKEDAEDFWEEATQQQQPTKRAKVQQTIQFRPKSKVNAPPAPLPLSRTHMQDELVYVDDDDDDDDDDEKGRRSPTPPMYMTESSGVTSSLNDNDDDADPGGTAPTTSQTSDDSDQCRVQDYLEPRGVYSKRAAQYQRYKREAQTRFAAAETLPDEEP